MARRVYFQLFIAQNILFLSIFAQNSQKECIKEISQLHKTFFPATQSAAPGGTSNPKPAICDHCCCDDLNYDTVSCQYLYGDNFIKSNEILKQDGLQKGFNRFYYENMFQKYDHNKKRHGFLVQYQRPWFLIKILAPPGVRSGTSHRPGTRNRPPKNFSVICLISMVKVQSKNIGREKIKLKHLISTNWPISKILKCL